MLVPMDEIPWIDPHAPDIHGQVEIDEVDIRVLNGNVRRAELKSQSAHFDEISDRPICNHPNTSQRPVNVSLDLAPLCPLPARIVEVVNYDDPGGGNCLDKVPPGEYAGPMSFNRRLFGANDRSHGVAHQATHLREERTDSGRQVALLSWPDV